MSTVSRLKQEAINKGLTGPQVDRFVFGTIKKLKAEGEYQNMISPAPRVSATPTVPGVAAIKRGVLSSTPVLHTTPTLFGGGQALPLKSLMQGKVRAGGTKRLGSTRAYLGATA